MFIVKTLPEFDAWLNKIKDRITVMRLKTRLRKAALGNLGDSKPVGGGVFEMREHFGPGWRMYYIKHGAIVIIMLGGGDKSTQSTDIAAAIKLAAQLEE